MNGLTLLAFAAVVALALFAQYAIRRHRREQATPYDGAIVVNGVAVVFDFKLASDLREQRERTRAFRVAEGYRDHMSA